MKKKDILIPVRLDEKTYRDFCRFDTMVMRRRWFKPVLAGMICWTLALAGLLSKQPGIETPAGVLAGLGLAIPAMFFGLYALQVRAQAAERGLKDAPLVYTITLGDAVTVENNARAEPPVTLAWERLAAAYRVPGCIYLYVNAEHAFLLPPAHASAPEDAVWRCLTQRLGENRCFDRRR